ncbi:MAG: NADP(H)-dependent aldo-keto reductase [Alphaproteobacteria bacterium]|nr:NADP(H)-dependent aldo-keto reductase [Alphaproteobacteria bacterium]
MEYRRLGLTDIEVSLICYGIMTFGQQNTEAEGHALMDQALDGGVTFYDTAEMYPVPPKPETQGDSERVLGTWMKARGNRDKVIVATKATGPGADFAHIRGGTSAHTRANLEAAVDASLARLQTDYIDLYQLHWPDRPVNNFGRMLFDHSKAQAGTPAEETLAALADMVKAGKIRAVGLSNETPYGVHAFLKAAEVHHLPRVVSIQNPYNLLARHFELGLSEMAVREHVGLLAYSPLAQGVLTGKYMDGKRPEGARITLFPKRYKRYIGDKGQVETAKYVKIALDHGLAPAQMALSFVNRQPFVTANIIGATTKEQLAENIGSIDVALSDEVMDAIEAVHRETPVPCP